MQKGADLHLLNILNQYVIVLHRFHGHGHRDRDSQRHTFRDGNDYEAECQNDDPKNVHECLVGEQRFVPAEQHMHDVVNNQDDADADAKEVDPFANDVTDRFEALLQIRFLLFDYQVVGTTLS